MNYKDKSLLVRFFKSWAIVVFKPRTFYRNLFTLVSPKDPFIFLVIPLFVACGIVVAFLIMLGKTFGGETTVTLYDIGIGVAITAGYSIVLYLSFFLYAWVLHMVFRLFGGEGTYRATLIIVAYSSALIFIPLAGWLYSIILCIIGIKEIYKMSTGKAIAVILMGAVSSYVFLIPIVWLIYYLKIVRTPKIEQAKT